MNAKQDTSSGLTNLLATAPCQYSGHVTINEIQVSEPSESLRVSGDTYLNGDLTITGNASSVFFCAGVVDRGGTKISDVGRVGYSVVKSSVGVFEITFNTAHSTSDYIVCLGGETTNAAIGDACLKMSWSSKKYNGFYGGYIFLECRSIKSSESNI